MISAKDMDGLRSALEKVRPEPFKTAAPWWDWFLRTIEEYYRNQPVEEVQPVAPVAPVTPPQRSGAATPSSHSPATPLKHVVAKSVKR